MRGLGTQRSWGCEEPGDTRELGTRGSWWDVTVALINPLKWPKQGAGMLLGHPSKAGRWEGRISPREEAKKAKKLFLGFLWGV